jgi:hypothetical protein
MYMYSVRKLPLSLRALALRWNSMPVSGGVGDDAGHGKGVSMLTCAWLARRPKHHHPDGVADAETVDRERASSSEEY